MSQKTRRLYAFGPFYLDAKECLLILDGKSVPLAHKAFEALLMLVENAGRLVDKDDLMRRLWPDTFVEEANVAKHVSLLRKILSEATNGREYIETIPKRGYRFVVEVREVADAEHDSPLQVLPGANLIGKKVSHYRIVEMLGGGGMGLVYKAEDLKLGRRVALKFLPEELASDPVALGRFEREARAASALNHPNICTIHGAEEHEGQPFIVMELLEGTSLRELISAAAVSSREARDERTLQLDKLLEVAIQVTEGLDAAHRKGIIHRDIKPANIFVTTQGQAKILDFGLAKLGLDTAAVEIYSGGDRGEEDAAHRGPLQIMPLASSDLCLTRTGVAIGTAGYMSPEQVRGEKLDARTDLFSFGMVLYEMATGQRAFTGDTAPMLREAILNQTPVPPRALNAEISVKLEAIIRKALEKNREVRYQDASEVRADLKSITASLPGQKDGGMRPASLNRWVVAVAGIFALLLVAIIVWFAKRQPLTLPEPKLRQLTTNSIENRVTSGGISPDGKYLAYVDAKGMHIKLIETGETQAIPQPDALKDKKVEWETGGWFPDSTRFLSNAHPAGTDPNTWSSLGASIWMVSVLGGVPRKLRDNAVASSVSPDGSLVSFATNKGRVGDREIWLMGPSGEQARKLYETGEDSSIGPLIWSKDGQRFIYVRQDESGETLLSRETKGGPITTLLRPPAMKNMTEATWLPDGRLIYSLHEPGAIGDTCNFWEMRIDMHTGETVEKPRRITNWATFCMAGMSATADSKRLAFNKWSFHFTSYVADLAAGGTHILAPRHFTLSESSDMPADWTPDSKAIIVVSNRTGRFGIYKQALNEDTAEPLVTGADSVRNPRVSPDGKWVLYFLPKERGPEPLMRVPITGGPSQLVLPARNNSQILRARPPSNLCAIAEPTEDGKQVIITVLDPLKGRGPELTRFGLDPKEDGWRLDLSPDGTRIAATRSPGGPIYILSLRGHPTLVIEVKGWSHLQGMDWAADGKGLFVADGVQGGTRVEVRYVDLQGNAHVLWENHEGNVTEGLPSPDGRHLAIMGLTVDGNMWMLENF